MAHKKGLGSSRNGRESNPNMLGVKVFAGQKVTGGEIIVRQRGTRFWPGDGVGLGRDHTIFATQAGTVQFKPSRKGRTISVLWDFSAWEGGGHSLLGLSRRIAWRGPLCLAGDTSSPPEERPVSPRFELGTELESMAQMTDTLSAT